MLFDDDATGTNEELTVDTAASGFADFLSAEETQEEPETPPTQQSPESEPESSDDTSSTEPDDADDDGESNESEEVTEEAPDEAPSATLDPNTEVIVKVNGEERKVTLDEALRGYSRTEDYTRKTQELATQRKTQESEFERVRAERQQYAARLQQVEQMLTDLTPQEPDWDKVQRETPDQFPVLWAQWSAHKDRMNAIRAEREKASEAVLKDQEVARQRYLETEQEKLMNVLPEWKDPEKAKTGKAAMVGYIRDLGYSTEEISRVTDHRLIMLIDKAMKYDAIQAKKPKLTKRIRTVKSATPGPSSKPKVNATKAEMARKRLAKTGRKEDFAAAMELVLDD